MSLQRLISGGQTGVDRAALDAAADKEIARGGWCPRGRRAEDGRVPDEHPLEETPTRSYDLRTRWNVRDADATLILHQGPLTGGTRLTRRIASEMGKPCLCVDLAELKPQQAALEVGRWLAEHEVRTLNVAGPRESSCAGIYRRARALLDELLRQPERPR